ncbi:MAG: transcriptional regulator, partial [Pseudanabaena sp.]
MRSDTAIFASNSDNSNDIEQNAGLSMVDILTLSTQQQQIINWVMRHRESTLEAIAIGIGATPEDTLLEIEALISQGFLELISNQGGNYYAIDFRRQQSINNLDAMPKAAIRPLSIILNPSGTVSIATGEKFELCVTVTNQGDRSAVISVAIDPDSSTIFPWCTLPSERLALSVGQSCEVVFLIQVPPTTPPKEYGYKLIIDAPEHYPEDTPIQYKGRVIVTPSVQEVVRVNDPTFATIPRTTSTSPHQMRGGEIWQVLISVNNRSERVDRFRVTIPDLDPKWVSIYYPEGLALVGVVEATEGLPLNPDTQGQITLIFKPPMDAWAGIYSPTIRVHSTNSPDSALLDIVYFEILPVYQLDIQLVTLLTRVENQPSLYEMRFKSSSNIARELSVRASSPEQEGLLTYSFNTEETRIAPYGNSRINLEVQTTKKCKPKFLSERYLSFIVEVEDKQGVALVSDRYLGNLIVPARPWWQLVLVIIGILGIIGTIIFLI